MGKGKVTIRGWLRRATCSDVYDETEASSS